MDDLKPRGIYPMLYAFFNADGSLDRGALRTQVAACNAAGVHGVAILGLATEVGKLSRDEQGDLVAWLAEDLSGRLPFAMTVAGPSVAAQTEKLRLAADHDAQWVILQPPSRTIAEPELFDFFSAVMAETDLPVAIQNAPDIIGTGLSPASIARLAERHAHFTLIKAEGPALDMKQIHEVTEGGLAIFNGRAGLELLDNLRAGCAGMIPSTETCDRQARIFDLMRAGDETSEAAAERLYREILPTLVFIFQSLDNLMCYGKRLAALRLGLGPVHDRAPALAPTPFGLACLARYATTLGPLEH